MVAGSDADQTATGAPLDTPAQAAARRTMVNEQLRARDITDPRLLAAMGSVLRHAFVPPDQVDEAYGDHALPIGRGQTISQPYVVALMTQLLALRGGERVLEVGTGSGYQAAVLAQLAREVYSIEIDPELAETARKALRRAGAANVHVRAGDGFYGWPEAAPFDAIVITAATPRVPDGLRDQLREGGRIVVPLERPGGEELAVGVRHGDDIKWTWHGGVRFVPMTGEVRKTPGEQDNGTPRGH
ncbi:MAG: protein-L-isoaspartate(D-aspartate) O-methyltransferase [Candidatus Binatia bacterium]